MVIDLEVFVEPDAGTSRNIEEARHKGSGESGTDVGQGRLRSLEDRGVRQGQLRTHQTAYEPKVHKTSEKRVDVTSRPSRPPLPPPLAACVPRPHRATRRDPATPPAPPPDRHP